MQSYEQYLRSSAVPKKVIDEFLDGSKATWARFDAEVGYTLGNSMQHDGVDGCWTISTARGTGARTAHMYADRPCRINTYGNSFTQCHQVSDGETWQEYLAAHFGEPIRNFGVGGFGVYQAYRRMLRTEQSDLGARYVLLYIWGDDHQRSCMRCRHAVVYPWWKVSDGRPFHANFWASIEMDIDSGRLVEKDNLLPTPEKLYGMTDPEFMYEALKDDLMVQLCAIESGRVDPATIDFAPLNVLAEILAVSGVDGSSPEATRASVSRIKNAYGFAATKGIVEKSVDFCRAKGKELVILVHCPAATKQMLRGEPRWDQEIADYLAERKLRYFDMNLAHVGDYKSFNLSVEDYMKRYFIGHYNPSGNHLFAFALKDRLVEWLDPKPVTYREDGSKRVTFGGYLPG